MAILGLGTDIVEIARIDAVIARSGDRLARRVLSDFEWAIWEQHQQPVRFLAKRFAVKEAAFQGAWHRHPQRAGVQSV